MDLRRWFLLAGAALVIAGAIGLLVPVSVSGPRESDAKIGCGNAIASDLSAASEADDRSGANVPVIGQFIPHTNAVSDCQSALSSRRAWSIPLAVVGVLAMAGSAVARPGLLTGHGSRRS
jgi:hypothetical protein